MNSIFCGRYNYELKENWLRVSLVINKFVSAQVSCGKKKSLFFDPTFDIECLTLIPFFQESELQINLHAVLNLMLTRSIKRGIPSHSEIESDNRIN